MYNEVPVKGDKYQFGDWKIYAAHNKKEIKGFFGEYRWLSNFELCQCSMQGFSFPSVENAYQAAKVKSEHWTSLQNCSPAESKKIWKTLAKVNETAKQWDARKYQIMAQLVFDKFLNNIELRKKLLETGDRYLEEINHWNDQYWGVDWKKGGENNLGQILMQTRNFWKMQSK